MSLLSRSESSTGSSAIFSLHSEWTDTNFTSPTVNLHPVAKPLLRILYVREVRKLVDARYTLPVDASTLGLYSSYLLSPKVPTRAKIIILEDVHRRLMDFRLLEDHCAPHRIPEVISSPLPALERQALSDSRLAACHQSAVDLVRETKLWELLHLRHIFADKIEVIFKELSNIILHARLFLEQWVSSARIMSTMLESRDQNLQTKFWNILVLVPLSLEQNSLAANILSTSGLIELPPLSEIHAQETARTIVATALEHSPTGIWQKFLHSFPQLDTVFLASQVLVACNLASQGSIKTLANLCQSYNGSEAVAQALHMVHADVDRIILVAKAAMHGLIGDWSCDVLLAVDPNSIYIKDRPQLGKELLQELFPTILHLAFHALARTINFQPLLQSSSSDQGMLALLRGLGQLYDDNQTRKGFIVNLSKLMPVVEEQFYQDVETIRQAETLSWGSQINNYRDCAQATLTALWEHIQETLCHVQQKADAAPDQTIFPMLELKDSDSESE